MRSGQAMALARLTTLRPLPQIPAQRSEGFSAAIPRTEGCNLPVSSPEAQIDAGI